MRKRRGAIARPTQRAQRARRQGVRLVPPAADAIDMSRWRVAVRLNRDNAPNRRIPQS
jgi:hypothetical protein